MIRAVTDVRSSVKSNCCVGWKALRTPLPDLPMYKAACPGTDHAWFSSFPTSLPWWSHIWNTVSSCGLSSSRNAGNYWRESSGRLQRWLETWSASLMRKGWETGGCSSRERLRGGLITVNEYLKCRNQIDGGEMTLWWCAATEQGATVKNWNTGSCIQTRGRTLLPSE